MGRLEKYDTVEAMVDAAIDTWTGMLRDSDKFDKGNKAAGRRVRKALQVAKKEADHIRKFITAKTKRVGGDGG